MELFNVLPDNLFNLFISKNKTLYIECLIEIYKTYEIKSIFGLPKLDAREIVIKILEKNNVNFSNFKSEIDEEEKFVDYRELANYFLRRLETTGWITIDVDNNYEEYINFNAYAVSIINALIEIEKDLSHSLFSDFITFDNEEEKFKGYLFTIYSLLNSDSRDYSLILKNVYKNTLSFLSEIRKVDYKLKVYISLIATKETSKDLFELLLEYNNEVFDKAYSKLKTFDNVNKYKFAIIKKLENMQEDKEVMDKIARDYQLINDHDVSLAIFTANKQINDCLDIYNSLDEIMNQIDHRNRDYLAQTLAKVKYLMQETTDVNGFLNYIMRFYSKNINVGKEASAYKEIQSIFNFRPIRQVNPSSLMTPRTTYKKAPNNLLGKSTIDYSSFDKEFLKQFQNKYNEKDIIKILEKSIAIDQQVDATTFIDNHANKDDIIKLLYIVVTASGLHDSYLVEDAGVFFETDNYYIKNFTIRRIK